MNKEKRYEIFRRLREDNPHPTTELNFSSPFELLVAVTLSAQATDVGVNKATDKLFPVANTPEAIYALGVDGLSEYIKTIGLFNSKARNVIAACKILIEQHNSQVPDNREALEALPGVGRKTANVVLNTAFGQPTMAVDTHIHRVSLRLALIGPKVSADEAHDVLERAIAPDLVFGFHVYVINHGRRICKAQRPLCGHCVLSSRCPSWALYAKPGDDREPEPGLLYDPALP